MSEWNTLPLDVRQSDFIHIFKEKLIVKSNFVCAKPRHDFYVLGDMNIVHTKLRHNCAIIDIVRYIAARNYLFNEIFLIENLNIVNTHFLLWGENSISNTDNKHLF